MNIHLRDSNRGLAGDIVRCRDFSWILNETPKSGDIIVLVDSRIAEVDRYPETVRIAWLMEPPIMIQSIYEFAKENSQKFCKIATFNRSLLNLGYPFQFCPYGTTWIRPENRRIHEKTKMTSLIASAKNFTVGHGLRHSCAANFGKSIDLLGSGYRPIKDKEEGLAGYRYSVVIENQICDDYFSEKLLDCFFTGTVPIYCGTKSLLNYFDMNGVIPFDTVDDLENILNWIGEDDYRSREASLKANLKTAENFDDLDRTIWETCLEPLTEKKERQHEH